MHISLTKPPFKDRLICISSFGNRFFIRFLSPQVDEKIILIGHRKSIREVNFHFSPLMQHKRSIISINKIFENAKLREMSHKYPIDWRCEHDKECDVGNVEMSRALCGYQKAKWKQRQSDKVRLQMNGEVQSCRLEHCLLVQQMLLPCWTMDDFY